MNLNGTLWRSASIVSLLFLGMAARAGSADALMVLTTIGYLTGAADDCKVASAESNALSGGIAIAISGGKYGDQAEAHTLLSNAKQRGVADAVGKKLDCSMVREKVQSIVRTLR